MKWKTLKIFTHDGVVYEVRLGFDGKKLTVRPFKGKAHANGISYAIELGKSMNIQNPDNLKAIKDFVKHAEKDILEGRWESYLEACRIVKDAEKKAKEKETAKQKGGRK